MGLEAGQVVVSVLDDVLRARAELDIQRQVILVGIVKINIPRLAAGFVVQIGRLVKLVIRGLDIAAVCAADLQASPL